VRREIGVDHLAAAWRELMRKLLHHGLMARIGLHAVV
jgi:hypothetical protein